MEEINKILSDHKLSNWFSVEHVHDELDDYNIIAFSNQYIIGVKKLVGLRPSSLIDIVNNTHNQIKVNKSLRRRVRIRPSIWYRTYSESYTYSCNLSIRWPGTKYKCDMHCNISKSYETWQDLILNFLDEFYVEKRQNKEPILRYKMLKTLIENTKSDKQ